MSRRGQQSRAASRASPPRGRGSSLLLEIQRASRASHIPSDRRIRAIAAAALRGKAAVTLRYVAEAEGLRLNREYRGREYATNVLTFVYSSHPIAGDIVICAPVVAREARAQGKALADHHAHLLVHGLLHLQGMDHENEADARVMERREARILARLGVADPYT